MARKKCLKVSTFSKKNNLNSLFNFFCFIRKITFFQCVSVFFFLIISFQNGALAADEDYEEYDFHEGEADIVEVVEGQNATLPCAVPSPAHDSRSLTLWYMDKGETPIFSYDQRAEIQHDFQKAIAWAEPVVFGDPRFPSGVRAQFLVDSDPPSLLIFDVKKKDARKYRCRVEFLRSVSKFALVELRVVVPPKKMEILQLNSPVSPGGRNDVVCQVTGGVPPAGVYWLQKGKVVDSNYTVKEGAAFNNLEVPASRGDLLHQFICTAYNNDVTDPLRRPYLRNVTSGPLSMNVTSNPQELAEGTFGELRCTVIGSNPPPIIKWFQRGQMLTSENITIEHSQNVSVGILNFVPSKEDDKSQVVCRAENSLLPLATLEDIVTLKVTYRPVLTLKVAWPIAPNRNVFPEGSDVFLECKSDANPKAYKVEWFHGGRLITGDYPGLKMSDYTLALNKIDQKRSGRYQCFASNVNGDNFSNNVTVTIEYQPACMVSTRRIGVAINTETNITCKVKADPPPSTFSWTFGKSSKRDIVKDIPKGRFRKEENREWKYTTDGLQSTLSYIAKSASDYGTLKCFAYNKVGRQKKPCIMKIVPAGPPEGIRNCLVVNVTAETAAITCQPGFMGGINTKFIVEVWREDNNENIMNQTMPDCAFFTVPNLVPFQNYGVSVTAFNKYGRSPSYRKLKLKTPKLLRVQTTGAPPAPSYDDEEEEEEEEGGGAGGGEGGGEEEEEDGPSDSPAIAMAMGISIGIILIVVIAILGVRWYMKRPRVEKPPEKPPPPPAKEPSTTKERGSLLRKAITSTSSTTEPERSAMNGVYEYTIYDSSGRYKGFSHLPPQVPGCRYPIPVAGRTIDENATTSGTSNQNPDINCENKSPTDKSNLVGNKVGNSSNENPGGPNSGNSVRLKTSRGWAKIRGAFVFIRQSSSYKLDFRRLVHRGQTPETCDHESKI